MTPDQTRMTLALWRCWDHPRCVEACVRSDRSSRASWLRPRARGSDSSTHPRPTITSAHLRVGRSGGSSVSLNSRPLGPSALAAERLRARRRLFRRTIHARVDQFSSPGTYPWLRGPSMHVGTTGATPGSDADHGSSRAHRPLPVGRRGERFIRACAGATSPGRTEPRPPGRFIRACAGATARCPMAPYRESVHPRVRGSDGGSRRGPGRVSGSSARARERRLCCALNTTRCGSSARARERRERPRAQCVHSRFIRACAGATKWSRWSRTVSSGSSARARERLARTRRDCPARRFIRACAGATGDDATTHEPIDGSSARARERHPGGSLRRAVGAVHPRVRGSDHSVLDPSARVHGSSARARERQPATPGVASRCSVHPRVRGSDSPTARTSAAEERFIRACAGATRGGRS